MEQFLVLVDKVGLPLALFAVTILVVLLMQRSERKDTSDSIKVVNDITVANYKQLAALNKDHRQLMRDHFIQAKELSEAKHELSLMQQARQQEEEQRKELLVKIDAMEIRILFLESEVEKREIELQSYRSNRRA